MKIDMRMMGVGAASYGDGTASCMESALAGGEDEVGVGMVAADADSAR